MLGRVLLPDLEPSMIRHALAASEGDVSDTELHHMHATLRSALTAAGPGFESLRRS